MDCRGEGLGYILGTIGGWDILFYLRLFHETSYLLFLYNEFRGFGYEIISGGGQWDITCILYYG